LEISTIRQFCFLPTKGLTTTDHDCESKKNTITIMFAHNVVSALG